MEKILLSILSIILGFLLSQSFNFINFLRRPRFRVKYWTDGVSSSYTGDPPETPWEIELGFFLENYGRNPAKNTRVFVSDLRGSASSDELPEPTLIELLELKRPIDLIPPRELVAIKLGTIKSDDCELKLNLQSPIDDNFLDFAGAETRHKVYFSAVFYVSCDEKNSFQKISLNFRPDKNEWSAQLLEGYNNRLDRFGV